MMSFSVTRVVVVAGDDDGEFLVHALTRMGLAEVQVVATLDEATGLCATNSVDACLAVLPRAVPDERPSWTVEAKAPGREAGVPSLLLANVVTPYVAKAARSAGYVSVIPSDIPSRLLYRWISALLQKQAQQARTIGGQRGRLNVLPPDAAQALAQDASAGGKPKLQ